ncbi:Uncharacterised protein [Serratia plymuthica]|nr:Uncharacterised protein [Serratia plymuthica]VEI18394.1 Uncharacterised protein [Serratia plymuthica]
MQKDNSESCPRKAGSQGLTVTTFEVDHKIG